MTQQAEARWAEVNSEVSKSAETYITGRSQLCKAGGEHSRQNASGTNESGVLGKRERGQFIQHTPADPTESCREVGWSHPHQGLTLSLASTHSGRAALSSLSPFRSSGPHGSSERHRHPHFADAASAVLCSLLPREGSTAVGIETAVPPLRALAEPRV